MHAKLIIINQGMSILLEKANWSAPKKVRAFTTTIHGGVSTGVYASMNLGDHVNDDVASVKKNRQIIKEHLSLPAEPVWLNQIHGVKVVPADDQSKKKCTADGSYTSKPDVVCAVLTADCLPLFLSTTDGDRVAVVHAGWRGLADGIIEQGVNAFGCASEKVIAWAGPCIGPDSFEIGDEVRQELGGSDSAYKPSINTTKTNQKWLADLYQLAAERLSNIGVENYTHSNVCTFKNKDYFSYRRTGQCGRMASFIWIDAD